MIFLEGTTFTYPTLSYSNYWLPINGVVSAPLLLSMQDILQYPSKTVEVVLECSGDKRNLFELKIFGEQWEKGGH
ncbi:molybdopterin-dependent oxidoreductase [Peribacillus frigoritolerans]|nr:molybdopterin-dependent oxidoreductase [Peribacillus frigoritolerans]